MAASATRAIISLSVSLQPGSVRARQSALAKHRVACGSSKLPIGCYIRHGASETAPAHMLYGPRSSSTSTAKTAASTCYHQAVTGVAEAAQLLFQNGWRAKHTRTHSPTRTHTHRQDMELFQVCVVFIGVCQMGNFICLAVNSLIRELYDR